MKTISVFSIVVLALTLLLFSMTGTAVAFCPDLDSDGHYDASCGGDDCDDTDPNRYPLNFEDCDSDDEDCNPATFGNRDADGDGFVSIACCNDTNCGIDCDDLEPSIHPIQNEVCNGVDDDCDGLADSDSAGGGLLTTLQFLDLDGDGYGDPSQSAYLCPGTPGYSMLGNDCNDSNPAIVPGTMVCHPTDQTKLKICMNDGMFTEASCPSQPKTNCVTQPNGTGLCQTKKP